MKRFLPFILLILLVLPASRYLFGPGYFNMHDDLQVMRVFEMEKCFQDGQVPCRWSPDMELGYGQPMFNFYSALPYYLGAAIRFLTPLSIMATVKTLFFISLIVSAVGMYLLAKEFWGKWGGLLSAILYVYAPYHSLDIYIRGAMAESFSLAVLPFLWLTSYNYIKKSNKINFILLSLSVAATVTTHNVSMLIYLPFTALWVIYWLIKNKSKVKAIINLALSGILGVGLGSFFFIPVFLEQGLIQTKYFTLDYLNYEAHFVTLYQLFISRIWGHGPSIFGPYDDISFAIGWPHWWLILPLLGISVYLIVKKTKLDKVVLILGLLALFAFSTFLTHGRSVPIWKNISLMAIIQFPWRFLGPAMFFLSFAGGAIGILGGKISKTAIVVIIALAFILNIGYFTPWNYSSKVTDRDKLTGIAWDLQRKSASLDYLPKTSEMAPQSYAPNLPAVAMGEGNFSNYKVTTNSFSFDAEIYSDSVLADIPVMYFPGWTVNAENKELNVKPYGKLGTISVELTKGKHIVQGRFEDTPARTAGNTITLVSFLVILGILCLI